MAAGRYSAGRIFLQVVPSFKGFQREIDREVKKANRSMEEGLEKQTSDVGRKAGRKVGSDFLMGFTDWTTADQKRLQRAWGKALIDLDKMNRKQVADREKAEEAAARRREKLAEAEAARKDRQAAKDLQSAERWARKEAERIRRERAAEEARHRKAADKRAAEDRAASERAHKLYLKRLDDEEAALRASMKRRGGRARAEIEKAVSGIDNALGELGFGRKIDAELERVRRKAKQVSYELSEGLVDTTKARRQIEALGGELKRLQRRGAIGMDTTDRGNIRSAIADIDRMGDALDGAGRRGAGFRSFMRGATDDGQDGANAFRIFNYRVLAVAASLPLLAPLLAVAAGGFVALGTAVLGAGAGLGVMMLGFSGVGDAVGALGDVADNAAKDTAAAAKTMRNAARGVRDAQQGLAQARLQAARSAEDSGRRIADAEKRLAQAQRDATKAQNDLREARKRAQQDQEDLANKIKSGQLDERQALIDLFNAQVAYNAAMASGGSTNLEKEQASIDLGRAQLAIKEIREGNKELAAEAAKAGKAGIEGNEGVVAAQERVADSQDAIKDAEQDLADARRDAARQAVDSARSIRDAQERVTDAQEAYREAVVATGEQGSASMQKLNEAMGKLSPAGRAFALYLHSLRDDFYELRALAQEGMLPGVQESMEILFKRYGPGFSDFVSKMAKGLGDFFVKAAGVFTSPMWEDFFAMMDRNGPLFAAAFGEGFLNLMTGFAGLMTAFEPFTVMFAEGMLSLSESFAEWGSSMSTNEGFQAFLAYLMETGPKVGEFFKQFGRALIAIGIAIAPVADLLLGAFTKFFEYIADMDPDTLAAIVTGVLGFVLASQAAAGAMQLLKTITTPFHSVLGAVVFLFIALGAALIYAYQHNEDFRESIDKVFSWMRENQTMLMQIAGWIAGLAGAFLLVTKVIMPLWAGLKMVGSAIMWAWRSFGFLRVALALLGGPVGIVIGILTLLGMAFIWLWHNSETFRDIVTGVFNAVAAVVMWLWDKVIKPYFTFIIGIWKNVWAVIKWGWGIIGPVFELFGAVVRTLWEKILKPIFGWIGEKFSWIGEKITAVWMKYIDPILDKFGLGAEDLRAKWDVAIKAIGSMWDNLKGMIWKPLDFVVNTIINKGFVDNFNKLATYFGTEQIDYLKMPALEGKGTSKAGSSTKGGQWYTGGYTGAGSKYEPAGVVHKDEFVIRKESTNKIRSKYGLQVLDYVNRYGELPGMGGYASGGLVGFGRMLQQRGFRVSEHPAFGGVRGRHSRTGWHYKGGAIDVNWPNGMRQSAEETRKINAIVGLAKAYGLRTIWQSRDHYDHAHFDIGKGADRGNFSGAGGADMPWWIEKPFEYLSEKVTGLMKKLPDSGIGKLIAGIPTKVLEFAKDKITGMLSDAGDLGGVGDGGAYGGGVEQWRDEVIAALRRVGQPTSLADTVLRRLNQESGGNPRAINKWDSNYFSGTPSKGLMQVIDPTFRSFRDRGLPNDIYNPMSNIVASMRYALNRYGSLSSAYNRKGGYAEGGLVTEDGVGLQDNGTMMYDNGGYLPPGITQVVNLTGRPEPVFTAAQFEGMQGRGGGRSLIENLDVDINGSDLTAADVVDEIMWRVERVSHGGKYEGWTG